VAQPESGQRTVPSAVVPRPRPAVARLLPAAGGQQGEPEPYVNRFELQIVASIDVVKAEPNEDEESP
jgi:hypothetical protein